MRRAMDTKIKQVDVLPMVKYYATELGLHDLFDKYVPNNRGFEIKPAQVLCMMIMNIVVAAKPLYKVDDWCIDYLDGKAEIADPITIDTSNGQATIQPQRTNNILERFFRDLKRRSRKRSGTISLNKRLKSMLADTPLIKNLDNFEYMNAILDGNETLEERFEKIDCCMVTEKLKAEPP